MLSALLFGLRVFTKLMNEPANEAEAGSARLQDVEIKNTHLRNKNGVRIRLEVDTNVASVCSRWEGKFTLLKQLKEKLGQHIRCSL